MQLKKSPFVVIYGPYQHKIQKICDKAVLENDGALESVPDC